MTWFLSMAILVLQAGSSNPGAAAVNKLEEPLKRLYEAWKSKGHSGLKLEADQQSIELRKGGLLRKRDLIQVKAVVVSRERLPGIAALAKRCNAKIIASADTSVYLDIPVPQLFRLASEPSVAAVYLDRKNEEVRR